MNIKEYMRKRQIIKQIGRANYKLEVNKIIARFREYFNNASNEEKKEILAKTKHIKHDAGDADIFMFLAGLGLVSGGVSAYHMFLGDVGYSALAAAGFALAYIGIRRIVYDIMDLHERKSEFLKYFSEKSGVRLIGEVGEMDDYFAKPQLCGENVDDLNAQLVSDACDGYMASAL